MQTENEILKKKLASQPAEPSNSVQLPMNPDIQCFTDKASASTKVKAKSKSKFLCSHCSSVFLTSFNLQAHVENIHLKIKRYACDQCGFKTAKEGNLRRHIASIHKKGKPFQCSICHIKFNRLDNRHKHVKKYH